MIIIKNAAIPMSDGATLYANVFLPDAPGVYPVVMTFGVYGKDIHFEDGFAPQWNKLKEIYPDIACNGSTGRYLRWEVADPERWVPDGFVIIVVDGRGSGASPGYLDAFSPRETRDYYECIEWAGTQSWSNGKVGLLGVSYLAVKQWQVAALRPPHLAAIVPWEGSTDLYREATRHGGILSYDFNHAWWNRQILVNQNGNAHTPRRDRDTASPPTGMPLKIETLLGNRAEFPDEIVRHALCDAWYQDRTPKLERIQVPLLSAANWGGAGLHLRGNIEGYLRAGSSEKWLFTHIGTHYESFYLPHYVAIQKRFFDHYLKGIDNGWDKEPPVQLAIRHMDGTATLRKENEWPLARTVWTKLYLNAVNRTLTFAQTETESQITYDALDENVDFTLLPFEEDTEFTGPMALRLWVSSSTTDMDVFAVIRAFDNNGREVLLTGAHETVHIAQGWLRASRRKTDSDKTLPYRPYHTHDEIQPLTPGAIYPLDIEIWPTSVVFQKGYKFVLTIGGCDVEASAPARIVHTHPQDRPAGTYNGRNTIYTGERYESYLLMPVIPANE